MKDAVNTMVVQVNGKMRTQFQADAEISEQDAKAQGEALISQWLKDKRVVKVIFVKNRLLNFVVADI